MSGWPNISRARVIRTNLILGILCLAVAGLNAAFVLVGVDGFRWFYTGMAGLTGVLALSGAWAARRDQARENRTRAARPR